MSLGSPVTPTVLPSSARGFANRGCAITAASGRSTIAMIPTRSAPVLAGDRQVVDVEDREVDPPGLEQLDAVGRRRRRDHVQRDAGLAVVVVGERRVDAGVGRVRA